MKTLGQHQRAFTIRVANLIAFAYSHGYELTFDETYRTKEQAKLNARRGKGILNSLHRKRLAVDFNLFKNGRYLTSSRSHKQLGEYWESLTDEDFICTWGGRFLNRHGRPAPDGGHYSITYKGIK